MLATVGTCRSYAIVMAIVAGLTVVGCGPQPGAQGGSASGNLVKMVSPYRFEPATVQVVAGGTVTWVNEDSQVHSVRFTKGIGYQSGPLKTGESVSYAFSAPGEYEYECSVHPQAMKGKVIVQAPSSTGY
jgi:plastocyanin